MLRTPPIVNEWKRGWRWTMVRELEALAIRPRPTPIKYNPKDEAGYQDQRFSQIFYTASGGIPNRGRQLERCLE